MASRRPGSGGIVQIAHNFTIVKTDGFYYIIHPGLTGTMIVVS